MPSTLRHDVYSSANVSAALEVGVKVENDMKKAKDREAKPEAEYRAEQSEVLAEW